MKYFITAAGLAVLLGFTQCAGFGRMTGEYEGTGQGWRGPVRVRLVIDDWGIAALEIVEHRDDPAIGGAAMEELAALVLDCQSTDLDAVSGATESSGGFLEAVEAALRGARKGPELPAPDDGE